MSVVAGVLAGRKHSPRPRGAALAAADAVIELFSYVDLDLTAQTSPTNHFDLFATYTATHEDGTTTASCITYYTGSGSAHKLRFGGLTTGRWTITTTGSGDGGLDGMEFIVDVDPSTAAARIGFRTDIAGHENQWARQAPDTAAELFIPQLLMFGHPSETGGWPNLSADLDTFMGDHGFTGLHVFSVAAGWFDSTTTSWEDPVTTSMTDPDPVTFERIENVLAAVRDRGGHTHIWLWGDSARNLTNIQLSGGKRGAEDMRMLRYIAGRLGPIPGWSIGYGFDLQEWATDTDVSLLVSDMEGWCSYGHWYGGRYGETDEDIHNGILTTGAQSWVGSYYGWEFWSDHNDSAFSTHAERGAFRDDPNLDDQPHMAEDRYRRRSANTLPKDFDDTDGDDAAIPILWQHSMSGISAIWGKMESGEDGIVSANWNNAGQWKSHGNFWHGSTNRFDLVRVPDDALGTSGTLVRRAPDSRYFAAWEGPSAGGLQVDYSGSPGNVDVYRADVDVSPLDLQLIFSDRAPQNEAFTMPSSGNWVLWIVPTGGIPQCPASLANGLVAYFKLDETSGTTASDSAGANDGTLTNMDGATDWVAGKMSNGLDFDGSDDFVEIANEANFDFDVSDPFSIFAWVRWRAVQVDQAAPVVTKGLENANDFTGYELILSDDADNRQAVCTIVSVWPNAIKVRGATTALDDGTWHHIGVTYDGSGTAAGTRIYVDGVEDSTEVISDDVGASILNNTPLRLGQRGDTFYPSLDGVLDDVRVYNRELTAGEVGDLYNSGSGCES